MYQGYPYYDTSMYQMARPSLLGRIKPHVNWNNFLNNTSRTLNVINQAIPVINQVKPLVSNARTMFKIANIMKDDDRKSTPLRTTAKDSKENQKEYEDYSSNQPTFFL